MMNYIFNGIFNGFSTVCNNTWLISRKAVYAVIFDNSFKMFDELSWNSNKINNFLRCK